MNVVARLKALFLISLCVGSHLAKCPSQHNITKKFSAISYADGKVGRCFSQVESTTHKAHIRSVGGVIREIHCTLLQIVDTSSHSRPL
jgi:hypothetical protein